MSIIRFISGLAMASVFVAAGVFVFVKASASQSLYREKMGQIQTGQVAGQTLLVVRKYTIGHFHNVVYRTISGPAVTITIAESFLSAIRPGDEVTAYQFPSGYLIPGDPPPMRSRADNRALAAKRKQIAKNKVLPQTFMVARFDVSSPTADLHCYRTTGDEIVQDVPAAIYAVAKPGDAAMGYSFPDGYFIPANHTAGNQELGKWLFLGIGILMGVAIFIGHMKFRRYTSGADTFGRVAAAISARRDQY